MVCDSSSRPTAALCSSITMAPTKLSPSNFPNFSAEIKNQEAFQTKTKVHIRQTAFKFLLTTKAKDRKEEDHD
eukprot:7565767-Ditylum_brightwellii.AAC.1